MLTNFQFVQKIANQLIRPRPSNYAASDIWQYISNKNLYRYDCVRFGLNDERFINLHLIEKKNEQNFTHEPLTCIVYLHGFSSFCTEGNFLVQNLQKQFKDINVSICLFDMRGHGKDKGKNITFGLEESKQLYEILVYLKTQKNYQNFILWGRSMGATTILKMLNDIRQKIDQQKICIKQLVLDSGFSSFQKVARQIISKKSGMPMIFSKPIFEYLLSAIEKQHKLKLDVELDKLFQITPPALFLYSENDDLVSSDHTKFIYEHYGGLKHKIQMNTGHNQERPQPIMNEVFSVIRKVLEKQQPKGLKKRSMSCKKMGLKVTKNSKRMSTIQDFFDDKEDIPVSLQNKFKQLIKTPKKNKQSKNNTTQSKFTPIIENKQGKNFQNQISITLSPRPINISKKKQCFEKKTPKQNYKNQKSQLLENDEKENINNLNVQKKQHTKKQQKLKLSHCDFLKNESGQNLFKNTTNIDHQINFFQQEAKHVQNQQKIEKLYSPYDFGSNIQKEVTSIFMPQNLCKNKHERQASYFMEKEQSKTYDLGDIKTLRKQKTFSKFETQQQIIKKSNVEEMLNKKSLGYQNLTNIKQINPKKSQCPIPKPQSQNIHRLKSKMNYVFTQQPYLTNVEKKMPTYKEKIFAQNKIRNGIDSYLIKDEFDRRNNSKFFNDYSQSIVKNTENKINFEINRKLYVSNAHELNNKNYI